MKFENLILEVADGRVAALLRRHGILATSQRIDIAAVMLQRSQHMSADQVLAQVNASGGGVSKATVYNTLNLFAERYTDLGGVIHWDMTTSDPWIKLPTLIKGRTREWITVRVDTNRLDFGSHNGSITFTDIDNPENEVIVPVQLYLEPYTVQLPLILR